MLTKNALYVILFSLVWEDKCNKNIILFKFLLEHYYNEGESMSKKLDSKLNSEQYPKKKDWLGFSEIRPGVYQSDVDPEMILTGSQYNGMVISGLGGLILIGGMLACAVKAVKDNFELPKAPAIEQKVSENPAVTNKMHFISKER